MTKLEKMAMDHATFDFNRVGVFEKMTSTTHAESFIAGAKAIIEMLNNEDDGAGFKYYGDASSWLESECAKEAE